jgi:chorismate mutase/prephenate dehydratase
MHPDPRKAEIRMSPDAPVPIQGLRIAYLGPPATFTHLAARTRFGSGADGLPADSVADVFSLVSRGGVRFGVVPVENSIEGAVPQTLDELSRTSLRICGEIYLAVSQSLLARCARKDIRTIYSHPQGFGQCRRWLQSAFPGVPQIETTSTARAAERAAAEPGAAALAGRLAAELYGLDLLEENIQDQAGNTTRFLVLGREEVPRSGRDKTSLLFHVEHRAGALVRALAVFGEQGINLVRIESRPDPGQPWSYMFFVDIEGHGDEQPVRLALEALRKSCTVCVVLGSYPGAGEAVPA